jgi:hypothetical protein
VGAAADGAMTDFFTAIGLILVIEGALYALFPQGMKRIVLQVVHQPASTLRAAGLAAAFLGFAIVWLMRASPTAGF